MCGSGSPLADVRLRRRKKEGKPASPQSAQRPQAAGSVKAVLRLSAKMCGSEAAYAKTEVQANQEKPHRMAVQCTFRGYPCAWDNPPGTGCIADSTVCPVPDFLEPPAQQGSAYVMGVRTHP